MDYLLSPGASPLGCGVCVRRWNAVWSPQTAGFPGAPSRGALASAQLRPVVSLCDPASEASAFLAAPDRGRRGGGRVCDLYPVSRVPAVDGWRHLLGAAWLHPRLAAVL